MHHAIYGNFGWRDEFCGEEVCVAHLGVEVGEFGCSLGEIFYEKVGSLSTSTCIRLNPLPSLG